jgi:putative inorganic carbon (HCO3(-)) transporter
MVFIYLSKGPSSGRARGTYGGQIALNNTSPIYHLGLQNGYVALAFTDNQWLEILVQTGVVGVFAFLGFAISTTWDLIKRFLQKRNPLILTGLATFFCFIICGFAANILEFSTIAVPVGIIIGSALNES